MIDLFLRADSEEALKAALPWATDIDGNWIQFSERYALDLIDHHTTSPAVLDENDDIVEAAVYDTRYHANLRILDSSLLLQVPDEIRIIVQTPSRVWIEEE